MWWQVATAANAVISVAYFAVTRPPPPRAGHRRRRLRRLGIPRHHPTTSPVDSTGGRTHRAGRKAPNGGFLGGEEPYDERPKTEVDGR